MTFRTVSPRIAASSSALSPAFPLHPLQQSPLQHPPLQQPLTRRDVPVPEAPNRRTKIWEFNTNLHCSIIGTCLTTHELRQVLRKLGKAPEGSTDHELHGIAVTLASRHDEPARRLHKALDHSHKLAVSQFDRASTEDEVRVLWRDSVKRGDIPGAYWATLTHEATTQTLIREAFGEVHMLSHLVGAANRADIRRLQALEEERAVLTQKLDDQAQAMHDAIQARDRQINDLRTAIARPHEVEASDDTIRLRAQVTDLERRLEAETARRVSMEARLTDALSDGERHRRALSEAQRTALSASAERDAIEQSLLLSFDRADEAEVPDETWLSGQQVLYVGGRPNQVPAMKAAIEHLGGILLHHDGGVEHHVALLPGLVSRADVVVFPVDCVSHEAANAVKTHCQLVGKVFLPLRSSGITSLIAGLRGLLAAQDAAAD
jgi:Uncharacterized protein conserved in bacteria (DUF2325)